MAFRCTIGVVPAVSVRGEREEHGLRVDEAAGRLQIPQHPIRIDDEAVDDAFHPGEGVVEQSRRIRQGNPFGRGVADVPLVPERDVLHPDRGVPAQEPGDAGDVLGRDRVALVGHRRRALLPGAERLAHLTDLAALQMADLGGETFEGRTGEGDRVQELGLTIPVGDLGRCGFDSDAESIADVGLDRRRRVRVGADGAGDLADRHGIAGAAHPPVVAFEFEGPRRELESERGRLGPDPVRPSHHHRVPVFERPISYHREQRNDPREQQVGGVAQGHTGGRVQDIGRGQAEVHPLAARVDRRGEKINERGNVVVRDRFALLPRDRIDFRGATERFGGSGRSDAQIDPRFGDESLDLFPHGQLARFTPDRGHLRQGVPLDHGSGRSMVASRPGPTPIDEMGTPINSSIRST